MFFFLLLFHCTFNADWRLFCESFCLFLCFSFFTLHTFNAACRLFFFLSLLPFSLFISLICLHFCHPGESSTASEGFCQEVGVHLHAGWGTGQVSAVVRTTTQTHLLTHTCPALRRIQPTHVHTKTLYIHAQITQSNILTLCYLCNILACLWDDQWSNLLLFKHQLKSLIWRPEAANTSPSVCVYPHACLKCDFGENEKRTERVTDEWKSLGFRNRISERDTESDVANVSYVRVKWQEWKWISSARRQVATLMSAGLRSLMCERVDRFCLFNINILQLCVSALIRRIDRKKDKTERKILDSQERAFWDVHRPVVRVRGGGLCLKMK